MKNILFLASGGGGNLKFIHRAIEKEIFPNISLSLIADRDCEAIRYAKELELDNHIISYSRSNPTSLQQLLHEKQPDFIVTNWHKIIDADTVRQYKGKFVNLHYSLLPAFAGLIGLEPIKRAYQQGCRYIGPTCHLVDEGVDTGKILAQAIFTTERSFDEAVTMMFRTGCLVLLNGLTILMSQNKVLQATDRPPSFSPILNYDSSSLDELFWQKVAKA